MCRMPLSVLALLAIAAVPAFAQRNQSAADSADAAGLRALIQAAPDLPVERIELKPNVPLEGISAIAVDPQGNLYVIHRPTTPDTDPIVVLNPQGTRIRSFGRGMFVIPHGIRLDPAGNVWAVDANLSKVFKFSNTGTKLLEIEVGNIPDATAQFCGATDVAFSPTGNGHVYVSDGYCNGRFIEYDAAGRKVREWGSRGTGPGQFNNAHGIAIGPDRNIYVADRENGRLQWFDLNGRFLGEQKFGGQFYNVTFDSKGQLWASVHPKGVPLDNEFFVVRLDNATKRILGKVEVRSHELGIGADGLIVPATRSALLVVYRPR
jgi:DNA-binding beta-propeller fold protein YncE